MYNFYIRYVMKVFTNQGKGVTVIVNEKSAVYGKYSSGKALIYKGLM